VIKSRRSELYQRELARVGDPLKVLLSHREEFELLIKPEFYKDFSRATTNGKTSSSTQTKILMRK